MVHINGKRMKKRVVDAALEQRILPTSINTKKWLPIEDNS